MISSHERSTMHVPCARALTAACAFLLRAIIITIHATASASFGRQSSQRWPVLKSSPRRQSVGVCVHVPRSLRRQGWGEAG